MKQRLATTDIRQFRPAIGHNYGESITRYKVLRSLFARHREYLTFAEPVISGQMLHWDTELEGQVLSFTQLDDAVLNRAKRVLRYYLDQMYAHCQLYENPDSLRKSLDICFEIPDYDFIYLVGKRPVITNWGFIYDIKGRSGLLQHWVDGIQSPHLMINLKTVDSTTRQPVSNAAISIHYFDHLYEGLTNQEGNISFQQIPPYDWPEFNITVQAPGYVIADRVLGSKSTVADMIFDGLSPFINVILLQPAIQTEPIVPPTLSSTALRIFVKDFITQQPVSGVQVKLSSSEGAMQVVSTDVEGSGIFGAIPEHVSLVLYASLLGYGDERLVLNTPWNKDQTIHLTSIEQGGFKGQRGQLSVNLRWNTPDDLDLHVVDPKEAKINFSSDTIIHGNSIGRLDVDANVSEHDLATYPQENIYWENPLHGTYTIGVVYYQTRTNQPVEFAITILHDNERTDYQGFLDEENDIWQINFDY